MKKITFDYSKAACFVAEHEVENMKKLALDAKELLVSREGAGNDFLGWIDLPVNYDKGRVCANQKSGRKDSGRFRGAAGDRYRRFLPWCARSG